MSKLKIKDGDQWTEIPTGGIGIPSGGNADDLLTKSSNVDYSTNWIPRSALFPTVFVEQSTSTSTEISKSYTVVGDGIVVAYVAYWAGGNGYGSYMARIYLNDTCIMAEGTRWGSNQDQVHGASTSAPMAVSDGDVIKLYGYNSKNIGAQTFARRFLCFGCTVTPVT